MHYCCVKLCGKNNKTSGAQKDGITFHRFPKCGKIKEIWIDATKRPHDWFPAPSSVICSRHFKPENFKLTPTNKRRMLHPNAVPTLNLPTLVSREGSDTQSQNTLPSHTKAAEALPNTENIVPTYTTDHAVSCTGSQTSAAASYNIQPDTKTDNLEAISNLSTPRKISHRIIIADLSQKLHHSKLKVKRLQTSNLTLKKQNISLKSLIKELEDKLETYQRHQCATNGKL